MVWLNVSSSTFWANLADMLAVMPSQIGVIYAGFWSADRKLESIEAQH